MSSAIERALNRSTIESVADCNSPLTATLTKQKPKISNKQMREVKDCFALYEDMLEPGHMYRSEFVTAVRTLGFNATRKELDLLYHQTDLNGDGFIDFEEWTAAVTSLLSDRNTYLHKQLADILSALDQEDRGQPKDRLARIAEGMADEIPEEEIKDMVNSKGILPMNFDPDQLYAKLFEVTQPLALRRGRTGERQNK
eukprot:289621-Prorocentrum_minimum.AAC.2